MENMSYLIYVLYICITVPIALMLIVLDKKNKLIILYLLYGMTAALFVGKVNTFSLHNFCNDSFFLLTTTYAPIAEELAKGIPVILICTFAKKLSDKQLLSCAYASGLGFAVFENIIYFCKNNQKVDIVWALFRGIGAGLMHSLCTCIIAAGMIFIRKHKKLYWCGLFSFASFAMVYHGSFNSLLSSSSSNLQYVGIFMPITTLALVVIVLLIKKFIQSRAAKNKIV